MALVIAANEFNRNYAGRGSIYKANDFINYLDNPLILKPYSQVALQSIKLNKTGAVPVNAYQNLAVYYGVKQPEEGQQQNRSDEIGSMPIISFITPKEFTEEEQSISELRKTLQDTLNNGFVHPDMFGQCAVSINPTATGFGYKSFKYKFTQLGTASSINNRIDSWQKIPSTTGDITYNHSTHTITANSTSSANTMNNFAQPLSANSAQFIMQVPETGSNFIVGLRRKDIPVLIKPPNIPEQGNLLATWTRNLNAQEDNVLYDLGPRDIGTTHFYDYYVGVQSSTPDSGLPQNKKRLYVRQLVYNTLQNRYEYQNVIYWGYNGTATGRTDNASVPIDWTAATGPGGLAYNRIKFEIKNEQVLIFVGNASGYDQIVYSKEDFDTNTYEPKHYNVCAPIEDYKRLLYPQVYIGAAGNSMTFRHWSGRDTANLPAQCISSKFIKQGLVGEVRLVLIAKNWWNATNLRVDGAEFARPIKGIASHHQMKDYDIVILQRDVERYDKDHNLGNIDLSGLNVDDLLGFGDRGIIEPPYNASVHTGVEVSFTYDGDALPSMKSVNSAFVRLKNLTPISYNAGIKRMSKIIYHLPRFDNSNNESGEGLYFEPAERTYIDLNNPAEIAVNQLHLDIITQQETPIDDLTGRTIIVLHFRESKNK